VIQTWNTANQAAPGAAAQEAIMPTMTLREAQNLISQWSRPWFGAHAEQGVWTTLVNHTRAPDALRAHRFHCLCALIETAVARARLATPQVGHPGRRLNQLLLQHWSDPPDNERNAVLNATTQVTYNERLSEERHIMVATRNGPFLNVVLSVEMPGTPPMSLRTYNANEMRDARGAFLYDYTPLGSGVSLPPLFAPPGPPRSLRR
jgi:hypothetical protein